tara:strand:+ start:1115 stop:1477 length:363 start_codon:yes stop_codon:yes gene_type:complete
MEALKTKYNISHSDFIDLEDAIAYERRKYENERCMGLDEVAKIECLDPQIISTLCKKFGIHYHEYFEIRELEKEYSLYASESRACGCEVQPFCSYAGLKDNYDQQRRAEVIWRIQNDPTW